MPRGSLFIALLAALLFGAATPAGKVLLAALTPLQLAGLLYLGAACGTLPVLAHERARLWPSRMDRITRLRLMGVVVLGGVAAPVLLLLGLRSAAATSVSLWLTLEIVATALLGHWFFRDRLTRRAWLALTGSLAAAILISASGGAAGFRAGGLVALACLCWGVDNQLTALIDRLTPAQTTFWKGLVGGAVNLSLGLTAHAYSASPGVSLAALAVGGASYGLSLLLYITAAQGLGATRSQMVFSSAPLFGAALSFLLLRETISGWQLGAAGLVGVSLLILSRERHVHTHDHRAAAHAHRHRHDDGHHLHHADEPPRSSSHTHWHRHDATRHAHAHWPDLHHRHEHEGRDGEPPEHRD